MVLILSPRFGSGTCVSGQRDGNMKIFRHEERGKNLTEGYGCAKNTSDHSTSAPHHHPIPILLKNYYYAGLPTLLYGFHQSTLTFSIWFNISEPKLCKYSSITNLFLFSNNVMGFSKSRST